MKNHIILNGKALQLDEKLQGYIVGSRPVGTVSYFAVNKQNGKIYIQLKNDPYGYLYSEVSNADLLDIFDAKYLTWFVNNYLIGKYPVE